VFTRHPVLPKILRDAARFFDGHDDHATKRALRLAEDAVEYLYEDPTLEHMASMADHLLSEEAEGLTEATRKRLEAIRDTDAKPTEQGSEVKPGRIPTETHHRPPGLRRAIPRGGSTRYATR
jgi:hypothetical protein